MAALLGSLLGAVTGVVVAIKLSKPAPRRR